MGVDIDESFGSQGGEEPQLRSLRLTRASDIKIRPVHWLWTDRLALGTLGLIGGREGIGKSILSYTLVADITRGMLPGAYQDRPRAVIVAATEDSWEHTIVPRLMAARADLDLIYRVDVVTYDGFLTGLSLPRDMVALRTHVVEVGAAMILLDPLLSRLDAKLDTHKDAEVRIALEPLVQLADDTDASVVGLIHVNKSSSTDPLSLLMGSRAFAAVARTVLFAMKDPDDEALRLLGQPKNNLGRTDLATLTFRIDSAFVADTDEGPVWAGRLNWVGEVDRSIADLLEDAGETPDSRTAVADAAAWLVDYLTGVGGTAESAAVRAQAKRCGHAEATVKRARVRAKVTTKSTGFPRHTWWRLPGAVRTNGGESDLIDLIDPTEPTEQPVRSVGSVGSVGSGPPRGHARDDKPCPDCGLVDIPAHHAKCGPCADRLVQAVRTG